MSRKRQAWMLLVHVCRRWRCLVFGSPRRLNVRLYCTPKTTGDKLEIWPALPLLINGQISSLVVDNIIALLKLHDRVSVIDLFGLGTTPEIEKVLAAMQVPFPDLTDLRLSSFPKASINTDSFLGGSVPSLRELSLRGTPFMGFQELLSSATNLTDIKLSDLGYISPETMVTCLSALTSLKSLFLQFLLRSHSEESQHPTLPTCSIRSTLPTLTNIYFEGTSEYLEDFMAYIDTPQLKFLFITLTTEIDLGVPQLAQFISRTPFFNTLNEARIGFCCSGVLLTLLSPTSGFGWLKIEFLCRGSDLRLSTLARVWTSFSPILSKSNNLFIYEADSEYVEHYPQPHRQDYIENNQWFEILRPFIAVQDLYLSRRFGSDVITAAVLELAERRSTVLPALQYIFLEGLQLRLPVEVARFIAARERLGHRIYVTHWVKDEVIDSDSDW